MQLKPKKKWEIGKKTNIMNDIDPKQVRVTNTNRYMYYMMVLYYDGKNLVSNLLLKTCPNYTLIENKSKLP